MERNQINDIIWQSMLRFLSSGPGESDVHYWRWQFTRRATPYQEDFRRYCKECLGIDCDKVKYYGPRNKLSLKIIKLKIDIPKDDLSSIWDCDCLDIKWKRFFEERHNIKHPWPYWWKTASWLCLGAPISFGNKKNKSGYRATGYGKYLKKQMQITLDLTTSVTSLKNCLVAFAKGIEKSYKRHMIDYRNRKYQTYIDLWDYRQRMIDAGLKTSGSIIYERLLNDGEYKLFRDVTGLSENESKKLQKDLPAMKQLMSAFANDDNIKHIERHLRKADNLIKNYNQYLFPPLKESE